MGPLLGAFWAGARVAALLKCLVYKRESRESLRSTLAVSGLEDGKTLEHTCVDIPKRNSPPKGWPRTDSRNGGGLHKFGHCNWRPNTFTIQIMEIPRVYVPAGACMLDHERIYFSDPPPADGERRCAVFTSLAARFFALATFLLPFAHPKTKKRRIMPPRTGGRDASVARHDKGISRSTNSNSIIPRLSRVLVGAPTRWSPVQR